MLGTATGILNTGMMFGQIIHFSLAPTVANKVGLNGVYFYIIVTIIILAIIWFFAINKNIAASIQATAAEREKNKKVLTKSEKVAKKMVEKKKVEKKPAKKPKDDDFDIDDLNLQKSFEMPSLKAVNPIDMDPLMQVFLERAKAKIMSNFNPPNGLTIDRDAKTTVQFTVERSGAITSVFLKRSSSNSAWDHLSMRAVKISKLPELPPTYKGSSLVLQFNFTPN
jgi:outer membrane biosynthesis protein TonB